MQSIWMLSLFLSNKFMVYHTIIPRTMPWAIERTGFQPLDYLRNLNNHEDHKTNHLYARVICNDISGTKSVYSV